MMSARAILKWNGLCDMVGGTYEKDEGRRGFGSIARNYPSWVYTYLQWAKQRVTGMRSRRPEGTAWAEKETSTQPRCPLLTSRDGVDSGIGGR